MVEEENNNTNSSHEDDNDEGDINDDNTDINDSDIDDDSNEQHKTIKKNNYNDKNKNKKKSQIMKIVFNVSDTQYDIVKYVGKKLLRWHLSFDPDGEWDVFWTDGVVQPETLARMQPFQKINHFPGMHSLARKNHLGRNLMRMRKFFQDNYNFFPPTWLLPTEFNEFKQQFKSNKKKTFIIKPEANCQGRGIFLTKTWECIRSTDHYVAQRYLNKPYLIDGLKFDLRIYVLLAGCDPLKIFLYKEGLARLATEKYQQPTDKNIDEVCMHLTNYAINKNNPNFVFNETAEADDVGHKRSMTSIFKLLEKQGHDIPKLWNEIQQMIIKTFCSVQPILANCYKTCQCDDPYNNMCFEILGFDIMLDHKMKPWLIEVNHTPSFTTDTPLDRNIKKNLIRDSLILMNISIENKIKWKNKKKLELQQRVLTGKKVTKTLEEKQVLFEQAQKERNEWESKNIGEFIRIYPFDPKDSIQLKDPSKATEPYDEFLKECDKWWREWTGTAIKKNNTRQTDDKLPRFTFSMEKSVLSQGPVARLKVQNTSCQKAKYGVSEMSNNTNKSNISNLNNQNLPNYEAQNVLNDNISLESHEDQNSSFVESQMEGAILLKDNQNSKVTQIKKQFSIRRGSVNPSIVEKKASYKQKCSSLASDSCVYPEDADEESKGKKTPNQIRCKSPANESTLSDDGLTKSVLLNDGLTDNNNNNNLNSIKSISNKIYIKNNKTPKDQISTSSSISTNIPSKYSRKSAIPNSTNIHYVSDYQVNNKSGHIGTGNNNLSSTVVEIKDNNKGDVCSKQIANNIGNGSSEFKSKSNDQSDHQSTLNNKTINNPNIFQPLQVVVIHPNQKLNHLPKIQNQDNSLNICDISSIINHTQNLNVDKQYINFSKMIAGELPMQIPKIDSQLKHNSVNQVSATNNAYYIPNLEISNNAYDSQLPYVFSKNNPGIVNKNGKGSNAGNFIQPKLLEFYFKEGFRGKSEGECNKVPLLTIKRKEKHNINITTDAKICENISYSPLNISKNTKETTTKATKPNSILISKASPKKARVA